MDYFSRKPDFPTFEDIYIARAQGAIELERRGDEVACRFGPDGPAFMLPQGATRGDIIRGCLACDGHRFFAVCRHSPSNHLSPTAI